MKVNVINKNFLKIIKKWVNQFKLHVKKCKN
jgi:hypothetical protein